jgi:protein SCO1/2
LLASCTQDEKLPILGEKTEQNGEVIYHSIPDFEFVDQDSQLVTNATFEDKIYVVDFFFTSCPTICPKVKQQMLRIYDRFAEEPNLVFLSHSIDTKRDTVARLKKYADGLAIETDRWHLVTGDKDKIYEIADDYFSIAIEDPDAPGGFDHSGNLILVDWNRHVRSFANGTDPNKVDQFMKDIEVLLKEYYEER